MVGRVKGTRNTETRKIVAVIDSIVSMPAALMPWKEMVAICNSYPRHRLSKFLSVEAEIENGNENVHTDAYVDADVQNQNSGYDGDEVEVWSVIDGAHSLGQEQCIDLSEAKPDFWVSVRISYHALLQPPYLSLVLSCIPTCIPLQSRFPLASILLRLA